MKAIILYVVVLLIVQFQGIFGLDFIAVEDGFCRSNEPHRMGLYTKYKPVSFEECNQKCSDADLCTAIEYHHDTERCEIHYWDIVEVDPVSSSRREGKVKCYTVCKGASCTVDHSICFEKVGDGACYGIGDGIPKKARSDSDCWNACDGYSHCYTYEFDYSQKKCKVFLNEVRPSSTDPDQKGKVCFKMSTCGSD